MATTMSMIVVMMMGRIPMALTQQGDDNDSLFHHHIVKLKPTRLVTVMVAPTRIAVAPAAPAEANPNIP